MNEIRYGVIGTGMMGVEHIENILATGRAVVTALADPTASSLDQALARLRRREGAAHVQRPPGAPRCRRV